MARRTTTMAERMTTMVRPASAMASVSLAVDRSMKTPQNVAE